ncbi:lipopolysaccharide biosynthesis protein [Phycicoccus sp. HDW14]|uniref:lipopolysaccharide biosynthesis protein n=1 Tax=Phycicoccus sp. HDW14 TaxID=2714941 RepID=UPI00140D1733|nr:lipopolysaccharide biosynthesis protein [Phycicoccus sp. HDW14]QIM21461.1 lipopolysaccharide biosynthesis protein [Phycicoccus sp. HDW14]
MSPAPEQPERPSGGQPPGGGLRDHAALSTYATAVQGAARLAYSVVIGRLGSRELLGQANSALSISVLTSLVWAAPAAAAGTRFVALRKALGDEEGAAVVARHIALRSLFVATVLPTTTGLLGAWWLGLQPVQVVTCVVLCWAYSVYNTARGVRFGLLGFRQVALWDTVAAATSLTVLAVVLLLHLDLLTLLPLAVGYGLFAVVTWPARTRGRLERDARREIDHWIAFSALGVLASGGLLQASQLAAHHWSGESGAGDFAAALSLATPMSMFAIALSTALVPPLVAAAGRGDHAGVRRHADNIARRLVAIFVGVIGVLVIVSPFGIAVVYGPSFARSASVLPVLLGAVMLTSVALGGSTALQSTRRRGPQVVAGINLGGLVLGVAAWFLLAPSHGIEGVAVGYLVGAGSASLGTLAAVWWIERQAWLDLAARFAAGVALVVGLALATRDLDGVTGALAQVGAAIVFGAVWTWLNRREVAALWSTLRGGGETPAPS